MESAATNLGGDLMGGTPSANMYVQVNTCPICGAANPQAYSRCEVCLTELLDNDVQQNAPQFKAAYPNHNNDAQAANQKTTKKYKTLSWAIYGIALGLILMVVGDWVENRSYMEAHKRMMIDSLGTSDSFLNNGVTETLKKAGQTGKLENLKARILRGETSEFKAEARALLEEIMREGSYAYIYEDNETRERELRVLGASGTERSIRNVMVFAGLGIIGLGVIGVILGATMKRGGTVAPVA